MSNFNLIYLLNVFFTIGHSRETVTETVTKKCLKVRNLCVFKKCLRCYLNGLGDRCSERERERKVEIIKHPHTSYKWRWWPIKIIKIFLSFNRKLRLSTSLLQIKRKRTRVQCIKIAILKILDYILLFSLIKSMNFSRKLMA